jgi:hypothetical protein
MTTIKELQDRFETEMERSSEHLQEEATRSIENNEIIAENTDRPNFTAATLLLHASLSLIEKDDDPEVTFVFSQRLVDALKALPCVSQIASVTVSSVRSETGDDHESSLDEETADESTR